MTKKYSIAAARNSLAAILHELDSISKVEITRRGQPIAVILSKREYDKLVMPKGNFWQAYTKFRQENDLEELNIDPDEVFGGLRDKNTGREIEL